MALENKIDHHKIVKIISGDCYVTSKEDEVLVTILGSCISACIRDPISHVGGMNHFLLPHVESQLSSETDQSTRYGLFAMESLINGILKRGGDKNRLEVKVFGGSNVNPRLALIGDKNVDFVKNFLKNDGFKITSEDLGGTAPRKIHYYPYTGKVMMYLVASIEKFKEIDEEEKQYQKKLTVKPTGGDIELF